MKRLSFLLTVLVLLLGSCQVPLGKQDQPVHFTLKQLSGLGRTIIPTLPTDLTFSIELAGAVNKTFSGLTDLASTYEIAAGDYTLTVTAYSGSVAVGASKPQSITVLASGSNSFTVDVLPTLNGTGTLAVTYDWPELAIDGSTVADAATITLVKVPSVDIVDLTGFTTIKASSPDHTASVSLPLASGAYLLTLTLSKGGVKHPTISEVVQIYDGLVSSKDYLITASELSSPPAAPSAPTGSFSGGKFTVNWTMAAGTQSGFHLYRDGVQLPDITNSALRTADVVSLPTAPDTTFEVSAFNNWGESTRVPVVVTVPALVPSVDYNLSVGESQTNGSATTNMQITWSNPANSIVALYRSTSLVGPYTIVSSQSGSSFLDSQATGLVPGTTYLYAIVPKSSTPEVYLYGTKTTTITSFPYGAASYGTSHPNPVDGVVSGTTMQYYAGTTGVPVLGVPYLTPDTAKLPPLAGSTWSAQELPMTAILAGGYTYWVWGHDSANATESITVAAFDSQGVLLKTFLVGRRNVSALALTNDKLTVTSDTGTVVVSWATLAALPAVVNIDFSVPQAPSVSASYPGDTVIATNETLVITLNGLVVAGTPTGITLAYWLVDGSTTYVDATAFTVGADSSLTIDPSHFTLRKIGTHEATAIVTDGTNYYDATVNFTVGAVSSGGQ